MKRTVLTLLLLIAAITSAMAYDFEVDGIYYNITNSGSNPEVWVTYKATNYGGYSGDVVIPETVTNDGVTYTVTAIGMKAFYRSNLTSVVIPNTVTKIGEKAFFECNRMKSAIIGNSVKYISDGAFQECLVLDSITIPNSVIQIGIESFRSCNFMKKAIIGNSVKAIPDGAFRNCVHLLSITLPDDLEVIKENAFYSCNELTDLTIGNSVRTIGEEAFLGCYSLPSLTIPKSVTSIGSNAFSGCRGLTTVTVEEGNPVYDSREGCNAIIETASNKLIFGCQYTIIPNTVTTIGTYAFRWCYDLKGIDIPNSVVTIEANAFYCCNSMAYVNFGNSVTTIKSYAFQFCDSLKSITIPKSVTSIGWCAFAGCHELESISVESGNQYYDSREDCNAIIETASNVLLRGCNNSFIPNSILEIESNAFNGYKRLTSIVIPENVVYIGSAFNGCSNLMSVTCLATTPPELYYDNTFDADTREHGILYVPGKSYAAYMRANIWKSFSHIQGIGDVPGDMNGDSELTITDVIELINCLLNGEEEGVALEIADVNGDGAVNITDVTDLINLLMSNQP